MMSNYPGLEARINALEHQQVFLNARIAEVSLDTNASYKQISSYLEKIDTHMDEIEGDLDVIKVDIVSLDQDVTEIKGEITEIKGNISRIDKDVAEIKGNIVRIEATMATKAELAAMEHRILDAFQHLVTLVSPQRPQ